MGHDWQIRKPTIKNVDSSVRLLGLNPASPLTAYDL